MWVWVWIWERDDPAARISKARLMRGITSGSGIQRLAMWGEPSRLVPISTGWRLKPMGGVPGTQPCFRTRSRSPRLASVEV